MVALNESVHELLKTHFGFDSFLPMQERIVEHVLLGQDSLVLMPTGAGKSLCYQLPALALDGITIVISPLIALMKDQVDGLKANGVAAEFLNSSLTASEASSIRRQAVNGQLKVLYLAPERLSTPGFNEFLLALNVSLVAIDEAHCISEWGHDFRPDYRNLKALRAEHPDVPMVALTATATPRVRRDIVGQLELREPRTFLSSFDRPNLTYRIEPKEKTFERLLDVVRRHRGEPAIIYCFSRRETDVVAVDLKLNKINALPYHAGLDDTVRRETQEKFIRDEVEVVVATIAFGMGIDKPDVRLIVHYAFPKTIEGYYQETGRAGRDGLPSECILFYSYSDKYRHDYFIKEMENESEREKASAKLGQVIEFCESVSCRRHTVLKYFGEEWTKENCDACDVCLAAHDQFDAREIAQKILSAIIRTGEAFGVNHVIEVLRGSRAKKILERRHNQLSVYGIAREYSVNELRNLISQLLQRHLIARTGGDYPTLGVTELGRDFLHQRSTLTLVRPKTSEHSLSSRSLPELEYDPALFHKLREMRKEIADHKGVPSYLVFGDKPLQQMAYYYPQTLHTFANISGVGRAKLEEYGSTFLRVIRDYTTVHNLHERPTLKPSKHAFKTARSISTTYVRTRDLLREGLSLYEVARQRGLTEVTVIGHMEHLVSAGEQFDMEEWLPSHERLIRIEAAFHQAGSNLLTPTYELLGGGYSYEEIRLVRLHLTQRGKNSSQPDSGNP